MSRMLLTELPTEIIEQILFNLPPTSIAASSQTCKTLAAICDNPLLWRHLCRTAFLFWDPRHNLKELLSSPAEKTNWKALFTSRKKLDRQVDKLLDQIINHVQNRIGMMETIVDIQPDGWEGGSRNMWDVRDTLLRHLNCDDDTEDVLARRFWAQATLDRLHRSTAIAHWAALNSQDTTLEQALAAFDMFVDGMEDARCEIVSDMLDRLAVEFQRDNPRYEEQSIRQQATALAEWLQRNGYRGVLEDDEYHNLPNNFIARALKDIDHPALPIICVAIYCGIASRIGIDAQPCAFPMHVYAVIQPHEDRDLDDKPWQENTPPQRMYIDAFRLPVEVPVSHLRSQLSSMGASPLLSDSLLGPATVAQIVVRSSRNIIHSVRISQNRALRTDVSNWPDEDVSLYAASWASVCLQDDPSIMPNQYHERVRQHLQFLAEQFQANFPWDSALFESHVLPQLNGFPEFALLAQIIAYVRAGDRNRRPIVARDTVEKREGVRFKIGQGFRHKRYEYKGVIIGWDVNCDASEEWMTQMGVDRLGRGRYQSFYNVLAEDKSNRYVAEDNIVPTDEKPPEALMQLAGRYFRRWDDDAKIFVSNIREEYPDD